METIAGRLVYKAFGFTLASDIKLPELSISNNNISAIDIEIKKEDLSVLWKHSPKVHNKYVINENLIMFQIENLAIFLIQDGRNIIVSPLSDYDEDEVRLYILGSCMGAILFQRKILPLHGSAVAIEGKAYAIIGNSGAGKSTLASAFINKGFQMLTDDVIAVSLSKENTPFVTPSYPSQKLWQESLEKFGMSKHEYRPIYQNETKYSVPVSKGFSTEPVQLTGIFELVKSENENIEIINIDILESLKTLFKHTFRNPLISDLGLFNWHFNYTAMILSYTSIHQLRRPSNSFTAQQLVTAILDLIEKENR